MAARSLLPIVVLAVDRHFEQLNRSLVFGADKRTLVDLAAWMLAGRSPMGGTVANDLIGALPAFVIRPGAGDRVLRTLIARRQYDPLKMRPPGD
jgi:hypothetical protein